MKRAIVFILLGCAVSSAATHYVDATNGLDTNDGLSEETPWKTITKVEAYSFSPGDQILFKRGETWSGPTLLSSNNRWDITAVGMTDEPIVYGAYGAGARPIFDNLAGASVCVNLPLNKNYNHFESLQIRGATTTAGMYNSARGTRLSDCFLTANANGIVSILGDLTVEDSFLNASVGNGFSVNSGTITVRRCELAYNLNDGGGATTTGNATIDECWVHDNGVDGIGADGDGISFHGPSTGIIRNCWIEGNLKTAICNVDSSNVTIYSNILIAHPSATIGGVMVSLGSTYGNTIYCSAQNGNGFRILTGSTSTHMSRNNIIVGFYYGVNVLSGILDTDYDCVYGSTKLYNGSVTAGEHSISQNPLFVDAGVDFSLEIDSPCVDAGTNLGEPYDLDYDGEDRDNHGPWDMGALERLWRVCSCCGGTGLVP